MGKTSNRRRQRHRRTQRAMMRATMRRLNSLLILDDPWRVEGAAAMSAALRGHEQVFKRLAEAFIAPGGFPYGGGMTSALRRKMDE